MPTSAELFEAVSEGNVKKIIELLTTIEADETEAYVNKTNEDGETPLHVIYLTNHDSKTVEEIAAILVDAGANPKAIDDNGLTPEHYRESRKPPKPMTLLEDRRAGYSIDPHPDLSKGRAVMVVKEIETAARASAGAGAGGGGKRG